MSRGTKEKSCVWPVIVHKSKTDPDIVSSLKQRSFLIRVSESVVPGSVIFPSSGGIAFLIVSLDQVTVKDPDTQKVGLSPELINRVDNLIKVHRHCYLLCKAPIHGDTERQIFSLIQLQYLRSRLQMLPVHNIQEAITSMVTIAKTLVERFEHWFHSADIKGLCKPSSDLLYSRLEKIVSDIQHVDFMLSALKSVSLTGHEILAVQEQFGNLSELAMASEAELVECGVDTKSANRLFQLFSKRTEAGCRT